MKSVEKDKKTKEGSSKKRKEKEKDKKTKEGN